MMIAMRLLITTRPSLRHAFLDTVGGIGHPLTAVIAERTGNTSPPPGCSHRGVAAALQQGL